MYIVIRIRTRELSVPYSLDRRVGVRVLSCHETLEDAESAVRSKVDRERVKSPAWGHVDVEPSVSVSRGGGLVDTYTIVDLEDLGDEPLIYGGRVSYVE